MSTQALSSSFRSNLEVLNFATATPSQVMDYRRKVAAENLHLSTSSAGYILKTGRALLEQSEFLDLQLYTPPSPNPSTRDIWYIRELIISIWNWVLNKIKLWWDPSSARILVLARDTLDAAEEQIKQGGNVLVLSLASTEEPGGGFDEGIGSQEEELCWRSDLAGLMHVLKEEEQPQNPAIWNLYQQTIHTPGVTVFRSSKTRSYAFLSQPFQIGILSCGAPVHPLLKGLGTNTVEYADQKDKEHARMLIYNQLHIAHIKGYDTVVFGAFGCGAFRNPPAVIANLYHEVIDAFFKYTFRKIVFAILDDPHTGLHNPQGNFQPFKRCFS